MKTHENLSLNEPKFILPSVRSLEEGPNYQPNWRWLTVQQYLAEIENPAEADGDSPTKLQLILDREEDEIVRKTLQFHCRVLSDDDAAVKYALNTARSPLAAETIKAMVLAGCSLEDIAKKMGTPPARIDFFEKLYFDVRRYLDNQILLCKICLGSEGHRWLQVAFERGWPGVEEVILHRLPKGPRGLNHAVSVLLSRVQDFLFQLEARNVSPSEKDLERLLRVLQANAHGQFPFLEDGVEEPPAPESETFKAFKNLPFGSRDNVRFGLDRMMDAMVSKGMAVIAAKESKKAQAALETEGPVASQ
jgi:hypothetical protein